MEQRTSMSPNRLNFLRYATAMYQEIYDNPYCGDVFLHEDDEEWHVNNFAWGNARERRKVVGTKNVKKEWTDISDKRAASMDGLL